MQVLKFRLWDKIAKRMILPFENPILHGQYTLSLLGYPYNRNNFQGGEDFVIQQFVGLQDRNGKDIYERDILKIEHIAKYEGEEMDEDVPPILGEVFYEMGSFIIDDIPLRYYFLDEDEVTIMGNIFENK